MTTTTAPKRGTTAAPARPFVRPAMAAALPAIKRKIDKAVTGALAQAAQDTADAARGPDPVDLYVGREIRVRRKALGISQQALAGGLGLTFQQVQKYERGTNRVSASKLFTIAKFLGCLPGDLFPPLGDQASVESPTNDMVGVMMRSGIAAEFVHDLARLPVRERRAVIRMVANLSEEP